MPDIGPMVTHRPFDAAAMLLRECPDRSGHPAVPFKTRDRREGPVAPSGLAKSGVRALKAASGGALVRLCATTDHASRYRPAYQHDTDQEETFRMAGQARTQAQRIPKAVRRRQLLDIARSIVEELGAGALTMTRLGELAGASRPIVYGHFPNSAAVAVALVEEHFEQASAFVLARMDATRNLEEYLCSLIDAGFEFEARHSSIIPRLTNGFAGIAEVNEAYLRNVEKTREMYQSLLESKGVDAAISRTVADILSGMIDGCIHKYAGTDAADAAKALLKKMTIASLHGLPGYPAG